VAETTVKRILCSGFRRTGKAMGQVYQCWWRICREINVFLFKFRISHVLRFIHICDLFTDSPIILRNIKANTIFILQRLTTTQHLITLGDAGLLIR
jgi:hypothetical protein